MKPGRHLKWILNIKSPESKDFDKWVSEKSPKVDKARAIELYKALYNQYIIGEPKSTPSLSVAALKERGFVGGYVDPSDTRAIEDDAGHSRTIPQKSEDDVEELSFNKEDKFEALEDD